MNAILFSGGVKSISDDDLCATCRHCHYLPGEMSSCTQSFPGLEDDDGYVQECSAFVAREPSTQQLLLAAEQLVAAYAKGKSSGSVDWSDVDLAHETAAEALDVYYGREPGQTIALAESAAADSEE